MQKTKIDWTEAVWNPSIGCTKVSEGCAHCYAEMMAKRLQAMGIPEYKDGFKFKILPERLEDPLKRKKPTMFFVNSMSDLFHEQMPYSYLDKIFKVITSTPQHIYQILTKRDNVMVDYFSKRAVPKNVWLGVTVENTKYKHRIDTLRKINASVRFVSFEPLLGQLGTLDLNKIDWVIVGGESGPNARPMKKEWAVDVLKQAKKHNVSFFFKQWGTYGPDGIKRDKKANGSLLLGRIWHEYPTHILYRKSK